MPGAVHEHLVDVLRVLAELSGHTVRLCSFPDGRVPDLLAFDLAAHRVLCADAKASEGPSDRDARRRLRSYADWLVGARRWHEATMLIACADPLDVGGWRDAISAPGAPLSRPTKVWATVIDDRLALACATWTLSGGLVKHRYIQRLAA